MADSQGLNPIKSALRHNLSLVASNTPRSITILVLIIVFLGYILYITVFSLSKPTQNNLVKKAPEKIPANLVNPDLNAMPSTSQIPELPPIPSLLRPTIQPELPQPAIPKPMPTEPIGKKEENIIKPSPVNTVVTIAPPAPSKPVNQNIDTDRATRRKTSIMLINNPQKTVTSDVQAEQQNTTFKIRPDLKYLLGKGKIMEVILETAINTDRAGEIRGIVARDVFAEDRKTRLIPKGSKIFGNIQTTIDDIYGIISINWSRIDLATGYSLQLSSINSVDNLGRVGITGRLDNKYKEKITDAVISSAINVGLAQVLDKMIKPGVNTVNATKYSALATSLATLNANSAITIGASATPKTDIDNTCASALGYFFDTTITAYTDLSKVCSTLATAGADSDGSYNSTARTLSVALQAASTAVSTLSSSNTESTLTSTQTAIKTAISDVTGTIKDLVGNKEYKPNITIPQGELIRIYIDQDYTFPSKAIGNTLNIIQ